MALLLAGTAVAQDSEPADPCGDDGSMTACYIKHQEEQLAVYGLERIDKHLEEGTSVRRAMLVDGYSRHVIAVEFTRTGDGKAKVRAYQPGEPENEFAVPLEVWISEAEWEAVDQAGRYFDRELAPLTTKVEGDEDVIRICSHSWNLIVESAEPKTESSEASLRIRADHTCNESLAVQYGWYLSDRARVALTPCAELSGNRMRNSAYFLLACTTLERDRPAASKVLNMLSDMVGYQHRAADEIRKIFAGASLSWNGEQFSQQAAEIWIERTDKPQRAALVVDRYIGETADRVLAIGVLDRFVDDGGEYEYLERAPVRMIFQRANGNPFALTQVEVGPFNRTPHSCNPNMLTGGGNCDGSPPRP